MKYLFFLLIIPFLLIPNAYAEVSKNFDTIINPDGSVTWTSAQERINDRGSWVDYKYNNNINEILFQSASITSKFDKTDCTFSTFSRGILEGNPPPFNTIDHKLIIDKTPVLLPACNVINFIETNNGINFTTSRGNLETDYSFNYITGLKWTHKITNPSSLIVNATILDMFSGNAPLNIANEKARFNIYEFDSQNDIHGKLKRIENNKGVFESVYESNILPGTTLLIDPTFGFASPNYDAWPRTSNAAGVGCPSITGGTLTSASGGMSISRYESGVAGYCSRGVTEWDISGIPDLATITDVDIRYDVTATNGLNCNYYSMEFQPSTLGLLDAWQDARNGTTFVTNDSGCATTGTNKLLDLGSSADSDLEAHLGVVTWWGIGAAFNSEVRDGTQRHMFFAEETTELQVTYTNDPSQVVTDLTITDTRGTAVDLSWSNPSTPFGTIVGWQINYTTPHSENVATVATNDTASTNTAVTVFGLTGLTDYSFRVGYWTSEGNPMQNDGNVANTTTLFDPTAAFTPGTFNVTQTGTDARDIKYERIDISDTSLRLNITATNTIDLTCNFYYKFAMTNNTYNDIANVSINSNEDEASFLFTGVDNEIIDVLCWDDNDNSTSAQYLITQTSYVFLEQIEDFRGGEFGTAGNFGSLDFILLASILVSMIGLNRVNEAVGVVFSVIIIGGLSVFQIIPWYSTVTASIALVALLAITSTRKE